MMKYMEYAKVDRQGRIVIPSRIRRLMGIKGESEILIRVEGGKIVIEPISRDLEKKVEVWVKAALNTNTELFSEEIGESWKWVDEEYVKRKLGLLS